MPFRITVGEIGGLLGETRDRPLAFLLRRGRDQLLGRIRAGLAAVGRNPYRARLRRHELGSPSILRPDRLRAGIAWGLEERPERIDRIMNRAAANVDREFEVLSVPVRGDPDIDWHRDHGSDESWPVRFHVSYSHDELIDRARPTDVKVPWELSRLQFLPRLAFVSRLTGQSGYALAAREILDDWDRANPVGYGINWTVGMEVALRAVSIILAIELLAGTGAGKDFLDERVVELLGEHGRFLYRNIEYSDISGNHLTSCLVGLLYLGSRVTPEAEAPSWREHALERLVVEIQRQVYPDGVCHEGSIPYHALVTELFLHALFVARQSGEDLGPPFLARLEGMLEFLAACMKPGGGLPVWGDADDGRVFSLGGDLHGHHRAILALGTGLLGRPDLWDERTPLPLETGLLLGPEAARQLGEATRSAPLGNTAFPEGGFFILRDRDDYCLVDCGDVGLRGRGGHGHNDALSVELTLEGCDVLVDTGSSSYSRSIEERIACIGGRAHNALVLDGCEPAPISTRRLPHPTACPVEIVAWHPEREFFEGRHRGYAHVASVGSYTRRVERHGEQRRFRIRDRLDGSGRHAAAWHFHLGTDWVESGLLDDRAFFRLDPAGRAGDEPRLEICWRGPGCSASVVESPFYPSYGRRRDRACLVVQTEEKLPVEVVFDFRIGPDHGGSGG